MEDFKLFSVVVTIAIVMIVWRLNDLYRRIEKIERAASPSTAKESEKANE